ncbi:Protein TSSC1 [Thelohanellus kitauei]|uniref:Protein TSSC1 n=1 Tax=Thelohanellus kitauei TaxID=669202 RepID=A0A0C2N0B2_THEKT|nr:Protein TSSC1 [Thelohanellus kitauei]
MEKLPDVVTGLGSRIMGICSPMVDENRALFLAGTSSPHQQNMIYLIEYHDQNSITKNSIRHDGIIFETECPKIQSALFSVVYSNSGVKKGEIFRIKKSIGILARIICYFINQLARSVYMTLMPISVRKVSKFQNTKVLVGCDGILTPTLTVSSILSRTLFISAIYVLKSKIFLTRLRKSELVFQKGFMINDIDFNPNVKDVICLAGTDCFLRFYDIRNLHKPIICRRDHSHWIMSARYNTTYDELIVSCGSDNKVCLLYLSSSSSSRLSLEESCEMYYPNDQVVDYSDGHDISVYGVSFCSTNSWIYSSVSFDGRFILHHVPKEVRLKVIL